MTIGGVTVNLDRGGTFTDVLAIVPGQPDIYFKLLSVDPNNYEDANIEGIRRVLEKVTGKTIPRGVPLDTTPITNIRLGTTVATNALLERKGSDFALVVTEGFKDMLHIGDQSRPDLFAFEIVKPGVLYKEVIEIEERVTLPAYTEDATGYDAKDLVDGKEYVLGSTGEVVQILKPLNVEKTKAQLQDLKQKNPNLRSLAVCLIHGYNYQEHEKIVGELAREVGFESVSLSHELLPMIKAVYRGHSACMDAYLTPIVQDYIKTLLKGFSSDFNQHTRLEFMMSDGGLCKYDKFTGLKALLSGPAGGVVGVARTSYSPEDGTPTIAIDMGGTSSDVSRFDGHYHHIFETTVAGIKIAAPQLDINTVAAGGGSILTYKNHMFNVGPESAGAHPGPICYKKNGYLTITDANLMCGRILPEFFPKIFGPNEDEPLDKELVVEAFTKLAAEINADNPDSPPKSPVEVAYGFLQVANVAMAKPMRQLTENKGYQIAKHNLVSLGGAGGQHANSLAKELGISKVIIHKYSSILSAYGIALADVVEETILPTSIPYRDNAEDEIVPKIDALKEKATKALLEQNIPKELIQYEVFLNMCYSGSDSKLMIRQDESKKDFSFLEQFFAEHEREFSFNDKSRDVIVSDIRVRAFADINNSNSETTPFKELASVEKKVVSAQKVTKTSEMYFGCGLVNANIYQLSDLESGTVVPGPALVLDATQTLLVEPGSQLTVLTNHVIIDVLDDKKDVQTLTAPTTVDQIQLSIFSHRFMAIAESMCSTLRKISVSANIKERMDFSCALFDDEGNLVANAPAVPVHLSSMSFAVKYQINYWKGDIQPGDILCTNHPLAMGSHLPDITLISPVFIDGKIRFYVGNRAHHAEIGGTKAGSMDSNATSLDEEGAKFIAWKVVRNGEFDYAGVHKHFTEELLKIPGSSPSRKVADNIADLKAQVAANSNGISLLQDVFKEYGTEIVLFYMKAIKDTSSDAVRKFLRQLAVEKRGQLPLRAVDFMDDGVRIQVAIDIDEKTGNAVIDFTGTDDEAYNCFNAPKCVTCACVTYCLRCHISDGDLPLNEGVLEPIKIVIPENCVLNPSPTAAISGGNGITSQKITDVIMKAFGTVAASYGCMNCICFGQGGLDPETGEVVAGFGFCETIGGGSGAGNGFNGFSGTQCNMTNTLMTDPEVLEQRYPCWLRQFSVRKGSGGRGKWNGGDGLVREIEFTRPCHGSVLTQRRVFAPYGMNGGGEGQRGLNQLGRFDKSSGRVFWKHLGPTAEIEINPGDILNISTPGGGGYGAPDQESGECCGKGEKCGNGAAKQYPRAAGSLTAFHDTMKSSQ